jgi:hypothetical protein
VSNGTVGTFGDVRARLLPVLAALALAAPAAAATPVVPASVQSQIRARAGVAAYVPTRLPFRYRYRGFAFDRSTGILAIRFADVRYLETKHPRRLYFSVQRYPGTLAQCGAGRQKTLQLDGNKVYSDAQVAWRCQRTPRGPIAKITASGVALPDVALGRVVASAKRLY